MKNKLKATLFSSGIAILFLVFLSAKPISTGYKVGDTASDFNLKNIDGKNLALSGLTGNKGAIVIFTCNACPFSVAYEDRIIALEKKFAPLGYPVIAINPNDDVKAPDDSFRNMIKRAKEKKFNFPYLHDATQEVTKTYGASRTPHVFILSKEKSAYTVEYIGAIDNNTHDVDAVSDKYVEKAVNELLEGKKVTNNVTKAIGCSIKWKS